MSFLGEKLHTFDQILMFLDLGSLLLLSVLSFQFIVSERPTTSEIHSVLITD